jgi:uncharacterized protein DUF4160
MPRLHHEGPWTFFCYVADEGEPPHVHVRGPKRPHAKFWLDSTVSLARPGGYSGHELRAMRAIILKNRLVILDRWNACFRKRNG